MSFLTACAYTKAKEGGYYAGDKPHDPNETNFGVTARTYDRYRDSRREPRRSVQLIEDNEWRDIALAYWNDAQCGLFGERCGAILFDHAFNAGPKEAIKAAQRAMLVEDDGVIGSKTRAAILMWQDDVLAPRIQVERVRYYRDLARSPKHRPSLLSWVDRVVDF